MYMYMYIVTLHPLERYLNWVNNIASPPSRDHGKENMPPQDTPRKLPRKLRPHRRSSLDRQSMIILLLGRLEGRHSVSQHPIIILHLGRLAGRCSLGQRPITIRLSGRLEIGLEQAGQPGQRCVPQWSIP